MSQQPPGKRAARVLLVLAWGAGLFLATRFFGQWEQHGRIPTVSSPRNNMRVTSK